MKKLLSIILISLLLLLLLFRLKVVKAPANYPFFPRSDIGQMLEEFSENPEDTLNKNLETLYLQILGSTIVAENRQESMSEYIVGFNGFNPDFSTKDMNGITDYGVINPNPQDDLEPLEFNMCVIQYKGIDLMSKKITLSNEYSPNDFCLGYAQVVYISLSGRRLTYYIPVNQPKVTVNTKENQYFLKEFCFFTVYDRTDSQDMNRDVSYHILINDREIYSCFVN